MKLFIAFIFLLVAVSSHSQINGASQINNCGNDDRAMNYKMVATMIMAYFLDTTDIRKNKNITYAATSSINADSVYNRIKKAKTFIPKNFQVTRWGFGISGKNNQPLDENARWITIVFTREAPKGQLTPYVGFQVVFGSIDPASAEMNPSVQDVIIISDKVQLRAFMKKFEALAQ